MHINKINDVHFPPNEPFPADTSELQTDIDFIKTTLSNRVIPDARLTVKNDSKYIHRIIDKVNNKYNINIEFYYGSEKFKERLREIELNNKFSQIDKFRFIILGDNAFHYTFLELKRSQNMPSSLIQIDSSYFHMPNGKNLSGSGRMAYCIQFDIDNLNDEIVKAGRHPIKPVAIESGIQASDSECGIFSIDLVTKSFKTVREMDNLHRDNLNNSLNAKTHGCFSYVSWDNAASHLPALFFKHVHSSKVLSAFLKARPEYNDAPINKKNDTLTDRYERFKVLIPEKGCGMNLSIYYQRLKYYSNLITHESGETPENA